ncbi:MAG: efflux RND transporter periplasmic adaptor subunit [Pseudohongiellaceae bacterium]
MPAFTIEKPQRDLQLERLANLLLLETRVREAKSELEIGFTVVNDTLSLVDGATAMLWKVPKNGSIQNGELFSVSASPLPEKNSPFAMWANRYFLEVGSLLGEDHCIVENAGLSKALAQESSTFVAANAIWLPVIHRNKTLAILTVFKQSPWSEPELRILRQWTSTVGHAWNALDLAKQGMLRSVSSIPRKRLLIAIGAILLISMVLPVRLSVLAPAELKSGDSFIVRSPIQGVVDELLVEPNATVEAGELLVRLDDSALSTELEVAQQELEIARAEFRQSSQAAAFSDEASAGLQVQRITLEKTIARVNYLSDLLARTQITATQPATVIVENVDEFVGRPVQLGERLLMLVNDNDLELELWLPVGDDIELDIGSEIDFFPNVAPDQVYSGSLLSLDYEAQISPLGTLAYRARATVELPEGAFSRIGMRGTGKLFGKQVSVFYFLFRRPVSFLRQRLGV